MNKIRLLTSVAIIGLILVLATGLAFSQTAQASDSMGYGFTYQGQLTSDGEPYTGTCDLRFTLFDTLSGGNQICSPRTVGGVGVTNGVFTVLLDFGGNCFDGSMRWMQIAVRCPSGSGSYTTLSPRQQLTPAPYALALPGLYTQQHPISPNLIGGHNENIVGADVHGATIGGGGTANEPNVVSASFTTVSGGVWNRAESWIATVGGGSGNRASGEGATVSGGYLNTGDGNNSTVGGGAHNYAGGGVSTIGGGTYNSTSGGNATIGGGLFNEASGDFSTVGGGDSNKATENNATVGGGWDNTASGQWSFVGGGESNTASGFFSAVGGGASNTASGWNAFVGGGLHNTASGYASTVPGGYDNIAQASYSLAAGRQAKANARGCFVWGDSTIADVTCSDDNRWVARASGGVYFYTNANLTLGAYLAAGSGTWSSWSDQDMKENIEAVEPTTILEALMEVPISTWNYTTQDESIRHIGPMAQDFYAAFGVGENDTTITTVDADGVALAAIQGLYAENQDLRAQVDDLEARLSALEEALDNDQVTHNHSTGWPVSWLLGFGLITFSGVWVMRQRQGDDS